MVSEDDSAELLIQILFCNNIHIGTEPNSCCLTLFFVVPAHKTLTVMCTHLPFILQYH